MKKMPSPFVSPAWDTVVLVCKDCQKRGSGPRHLKTKTALSVLRHSLRSLRPRPRVVASSCLGLCPKRALTVAVVGGLPGACAGGEAGGQSGALLMGVSSEQALDEAARAVVARGTGDRPCAG